MRRVVSLFLPHFPTDRRQRLPAGASPEPLILARREGSRRLVAAVDRAAAALGLAPGIPVAEAQLRVPGLAVAEATPEADAAALTRLAGWCLRLSPLAAPCPPDGVWIDTAGADHLFGGEAALLRRLVTRLEATGFVARAAIADTPGCAHAVARFGKAVTVVVPPGAAPAALAAMPLAALRLDPATVAGLRRLGIGKVSELAAMPRGPLVRRFGATALRRLDQAMGAAPEPIEPVRPAGICRSRQGFPEPIATAEDLARVTALLAESLCEKLRRRGEGARELDLVFLRVDGTAQAVRVGTAAASRDAAHLTRLLTARLESIDPGFGVDSVSLSASRTDRLEAQQTVSSLAGPTTPELTWLIDRLANRLGTDAVFRTRPVQSDLPERAVARTLPLAPTGAAAEGAGWPDRLPRPPRLFDPPQPIEALALLPDAAPTRFTWRGQRHRVCRADGPERVFGEWWRAADETWSVRDYFQVEDEAGGRFWLFRRGDGTDAATGDLRWFLHGVFG